MRTASIGRLAATNLIKNASIIFNKRIFNMNKKISLIFCLIATAGALMAKDLRMDKFESYIKTEQQIKKRNHPSLLFSEKDIPALRKKMNDPYFKNYVKDLLALADYNLERFPDNHDFPFTENPNFQSVSETFVMAYLLTGNKKYSKRAINLACAFVDKHYMKVPVRDTGKFTKHLNDGNSISFVLNTVAIVYDSLYNEMNEKERFLIRKGLAYFCKITYEMAITEEYGLGFHKNYCAGQMGALGLACLAIEKETFLESHDWLEKAMRISIAWCNVAVKSDGVYPEGVTYLYYMLRNQGLFFEALKNKKGIDYFKKTNLKKALIWTLWSSLPWDYEFDNFSDGKYVVRMSDIPYIIQNNYPGYGDYLVSKVCGTFPRYMSNPWAILFGRKPDLKNFDPAKKLGSSRLFKAAGMAGFRSGWGKDDTLLLAYATDYEYASHSQADRGQFNLYAYDRKWAVDSGYGNDAKRENSSTPSQAHNIVLIDGKGEGFDPTMRQSGTFAEIDAYVADDSMGYVRIDQKDAYDFFVRYHYVNKREYNKVEKAFRNIIFINKGETPSYTLIYDDIAKDKAKHKYTWQLHTAPGNAIDCEPDGALIKPLSFKGQTIYAQGSGGWDEFIMPGFSMIRRNAGDVTFKVDAEYDDYVLWALARGDAYGWANAEVWANGRKISRFQLGNTRSFSWVKFSANKKKMHKPEMVKLKTGENIIQLKGVFSGYEIARMLLTKDKNYVPEGFNPKGSGLIIFGAKNILSKEDVIVRDTNALCGATCSVNILHPKDCAVKQDFYQPSRDPVHARLTVEAEAVNPNFLTMLYPRKEGMQAPEITSASTEKLIHSTVLWKDVEDHALVRLNDEQIKINGIETDAKMLFCRFGKNKKLVRLLATDAKKLRIGGKQFLDVESPQSIIFADGKIKKKSD